MKTKTDKATARPWRWQPEQGVCAVYGKSTTPVCLTDGKDSFETIANAELITQAVNEHAALVAVASAAKALAKRVSDRHEDEKSDWREDDFNIYLRTTEALIALAALHDEKEASATA